MVASSATPSIARVLAFTLNTAAYQAEIFRGAIRSVPRGQWEAARRSGCTGCRCCWKVVLPQAAIVALRPLGNEIILLIKGSAVASIVTVLDLMGETRLAFSRSYDLTIYLYAAVLYLILVETIRRLWNVLERRLTRHLRRDVKAKSDRALLTSCPRRARSRQPFEIERRRTWPRSPSSGSA